MSNKKAMILETLNSVSTLCQNRTEDGLIKLSGVFGVCGVRNRNNRVYTRDNYAKVVETMQKRIDAEGAIPGELEHPDKMTITLDNISHKVTRVSIDENGVVTGDIVLLDTPKGKTAQAIVEGGLPLYISSRGSGSVDANGNVCLEAISTYDLVGTPGFAEAKLGRCYECLDESCALVFECVDAGDNETASGSGEDIKAETVEALNAVVKAASSSDDDIRSEVVEALSTVIDACEKTNEDIKKESADAIMALIEALESKELETAGERAFKTLLECAELNELENSVRLIKEENERLRKVYSKIHESYLGMDVDSVAEAVIKKLEDRRDEAIASRERVDGEDRIIKAMNEDELALWSRARRDWKEEQVAAALNETDMRRYVKTLGWDESGAVGTTVKESYEDEWLARMKSAIDSLR